MKTFILIATLLVTACAHQQAANPPYEQGVLPPTPTHCGGAPCADNEYCRSGRTSEQCVRIPIIAL